MSPFQSPHRPLHPSFPQPEDAHVQVWRYMDLPRLISLLTRQQLLLSRADLMTDPFEGSIPKRLLQTWSASTPTAAHLDRLRAEIRRGAYISSWHENSRESEAMWRLYCGAGEGVALSTRYAVLDQALAAHPHVQIGRVTYVDYHTEGWQQAFANGLSPFMCKRASFEHEREIRILGWADQLDSTGQCPPDIVGLDWNIAEAVERVWVSPYAPRWYFDVVAAVLDRFAPEIAGRLTWSEMTESPWF